MLACTGPEAHGGVVQQITGIGQSHSTAVAAEKKVRQWLAGDATLALGSRPCACANCGTDRARMAA